MYVIYVITAVTMYKISLISILLETELKPINKYFGIIKAYNLICNKIEFDIL